MKNTSITNDTKTKLTDYDKKVIKNYTSQLNYFLIHKATEKSSLLN